MSHHHDHDHAYAGSRSICSLNHIFRCFNSIKRLVFRLQFRPSQSHQTDHTSKFHKDMGAQSIGLHQITILQPWHWFHSFALQKSHRSPISRPVTRQFWRRIAFTPAAIQFIHTVRYKVQTHNQRAGFIVSFSNSQKRIQQPIKL